MRRDHCEITDRNEMIRILNSTNIGRMATKDAQGYPYITPVNFVFHRDCIYFHCAPKGEKLDNLLRDPRVCFEVDIPLSYLEVTFNPEKNPCRAHQLYHSVVIRGRARILPNEQLKADVLNALVAKHEGHFDFTPITPEAPDCRACHVVEIRPEIMTGKSDLLQNKPQDGARLEAARNLARRGLPGDLEAVKAMGYELTGNAENGWRVKE